MPTLRLSEPGRLLFGLAESFGFWPDDSIVVALIDEGHLNGVMRLDRADASPATLQHVLAPSLRPGLGSLVLLGGFGDRHLIDPVLRDAELIVPPDRFVDRLGTDGTTVWVGDGPEAPLPPGHGRVGDGMMHSPHGILTTRDDVVRCVQAPDIAEQATLLAVVQQVDERVAGLSGSEALDRVRELVARGLDAPQRLSSDELVELGVLLVDMNCRDAAWVSIDEQNAEASLALWLDVRRYAIDLVAPQALCMAATAAWLLKRWVVMAECLYQSAELDPEHSLTTLLITVLERGVPPQMWRRIVQGLGH